MNSCTKARILRILREGALPCWIGLNTFVAAVTVFSAYAGYINQEYMPFAGLVGMTFPAWYLLSFCLLIADFIIWKWKWAAVVPGAALIACLSPWLDFCPMHFSKHKLTAEEEQRAFRILSYNVVSFVDEQGKSTPDFNRTMHTVLHSGADIVAMMEYESQGPLWKYVPQSQIDSLHEIYPYFEPGDRGTVLYSKRPIIYIKPPENKSSRGSIEAFRTSVCGRALNVFAVHLESIGLNDNDKELYRGLTAQGLEDDVDYGRVRTQLIDKLYDSFINRSRQAKLLRSYVEQLGGDAVICGDFNDVPGCRTIRILEEIGMKDAYAETAFGPCITFNAPKFAFRIDHVLYRGEFRAVSIERGNVPSSDHYPMLTTFVWNADAQRGTNDWYELSE